MKNNSLKVFTNRFICDKMITVKEIRKAAPQADNLNKRLFHQHLKSDCLIILTFHYSLFKCKFPKQKYCLIAKVNSSAEVNSTMP